MADLKDFPHPLNTPIVTEEEIEKNIPVMNPETKEITFEKVKEKVRSEVTYHHVPSTIISCKRGEHYYLVRDPKKWIVKCKYCTKNRFLSPIHHRLDRGHIVNRRTSEILE